MGKKTILVVAGSGLCGQVEGAVQHLEEIEVVCAVTGEAVTVALASRSLVAVLVEDVTEYVDIVVTSAAPDNTWSIPVIFLGSGEDGAKEVRGLEGYAFVDFVPVPLDANLLTLKIDMFVHLFLLQEKLVQQEKLLEDRSLEIEVLQQELAEKNDEIMQLSSLDPLTGLFNRYYFDGNLQKEWRQALRQDDWLSLLLIDVDCLKEYNASVGYDAGDSCLQELALTLHQALLRPVDIIARYGGDQFAVILPGTGEEGATLVAKRFIERVAELEIPHNGSPAGDVVTISIGAATTAPKNRGKVADFIHSAERSLEAAKAEGGNCLRAESL